MKIVLDMNLSPEWVTAFRSVGVDAVHWSFIGSSHAEDDEILRYVRDANAILITHDLDFPRLLALARAKGPSVILIRAQDIEPRHWLRTLARVIDEHKVALEAGAIVTVDETRSRVRILPLY